MPRKSKKKKEEDEPDPWINSEAKAVLRQAIIEGNIPSTMPFEEVYEMCDLFKEYPRENFKTNLKNLREAIAKDYDRMAEDAEAYGHDVELRDILRQRNPPRLPPYPNWHTHEARHLLQADIATEKHKAMKPKDLYLTQTKYQDFPLDVFRDHIYQEADKMGRQKARFDKKKLRAMLLKPRETVLTAEESKAVREGTPVPARYSTHMPNQLAVKESEEYIQQMKRYQTAESRKAAAKLKKESKKTKATLNTKENSSNNINNSQTTVGKSAADRKKAALKSRAKK